MTKKKNPSELNGKQGNSSNELPEDSSIYEKTKFLKGLIEKHIKGFDDRRKENRRNALIMKVSITALGSLVTILLGFRSVNQQESLANIALVFSGVLTILNGLDVFFDYRSFWLRYTTTANRLRAVRDDLEYYLKSGWDSIEEQEIDGFYKRLTSILEETNEAWLTSRKEQKSPLS